MRKIAVLLLCFAISGIALANEAESRESFSLVSMLIRDGLNRNFEEIQQESFNLTANQRLILFHRHQDRLVTPLALNVLLGFGIGSFTQRDMTGGLIGLAGDTTVFALIVSGFIYGFNTTSRHSGNVLGGLFSAGLIISPASRIFQIVRPITFSERYNNSLRTALFHDGDLSFNISPAVDSNGNSNVTMALRYRF